MARRLIMFFLMFFPVALHSQNVQLHIGKDVKVVSEIEDRSEHLYAYAYLEGTGEYGFFSQFIVEPKLVGNLSLHTEARTDMNRSSFFIGALYCVPFQCGFLNIEPIARIEEGLQFQTSFVYGIELWKFNLFGYLDMWNFKRFRAYSENRLYFKFCDNISIGIIVCLDYAERLSLMSSFGIKIDL